MHMTRHLLTATYSLQHTHCNILTATYSLQHIHCNILTATYSRVHAISHARIESCVVQRVCVTHTLHMHCNQLYKQSSMDMQRELKVQVDTDQAASQ